MKSLRKRRGRWQDNIQMGLKEIRWVRTGVLWLRTGASCRGLWSRSRNFGLHKMLNISSAAEQLPGFSSMESWTVIFNHSKPFHINYVRLKMTDTSQESAWSSKRWLWIRSSCELNLWTEWELKTAVTSYPDLFHSHFFCVTGNLYAVSTIQARAAPAAVSTVLLCPEGVNCRRQEKRRS